MIERVFFVYVDRTNDGRVFYVGKGQLKRVISISKIKRNKHWGFICEKYGFSREIILATKDELSAFEIETAFIKQYKTFEADWKDGSGWGANYTRGGDGMSGRSGSLNPQFGKKHTEEAKRSMSLKRKGKKLKPLSEETKKKLSELNAGEKHPMFGITGEAHHNFGRKWSPESNRSKASIGEKNPRVKIKESDVLKIRMLYKTSLYSCKQIANMFGIANSQVWRIVKNQSWTHVKDISE